MERFGRIALKTILWIIASVIFLVLLVVILIQVPAVQNFAKDKAVTFLEGKIHTKVKIGHITLGIPKMLVLEDVYFEDQKRDTLIAGEKLKVDIDMLGLLKSKVQINEINLQGITAKISRDKDSTFNFDYIIKAFASEQKKEPKPKDTTSTLQFKLDKIILDRINIAYKDVTTGNDVKFLLGHFDTRVKEFDLDKMKFSIPKINLSDVDAVVIQTPAGSSVKQAAAVDTATTPLNLTLDLGTIDISKIRLNYRSNELATKLDLGKFLVEMDDIDLKNQRVGIKSIELSDTRAALSLAKPQTVQKAVAETARKIDTLVSRTQAKGWALKLAKLQLNNDNVRFDNNAQAPLRRGLDYGHMDIKNLNSEIEDLSYNPDTISGKIKSLAFTDKSGLAVKQFHTNFFYGPKNAYLNDLLLQTPQTIIQKQLQVSYPSIESISKNIGALRINANLDGSRLGLRDVLLIMPTMASMPPFNKMPNGTLRINGRIIGAVNNLNIPNIEISGLTSTHIKASAVLKGLPDVNKAYFDVNIADFNINRRDIYSVAPAGSIPNTITIPENLNLKGNLKGSMNDFNTRLNLRSSLGNLSAVASAKNIMSKNKNSASYSADIKADNLNAGALIKQPQMVGRVTATINVKGRGLDPKRANLQFNGNVASAYVKGYNYRNLTLRGTAANGHYVTVARMTDPNINFNLNAKANLNKKYPAIYATLDVDSINLQRLHFTTTPMSFHGKILADVPTADPDYLNADVQVTDMVFRNGTQRIALDSISLVSTATPDSSSLLLKTPFARAHLGGKYKLTEIAPAMQDVVNKYFNTALASGPSAKPGKYSPQQFNFDLRVVKTDLVTQFVPDLKQLDPIIINGRFNSQSGELVVNGTMPKIVYGTNVVDNGKLNINTGNNALNYALTFDQISTGPSIKILYPSISGSAQNNKLNVSLQVRDAAKKERYRIAGVFNVLPNAYQFSFLQDGLLLDYTQWAVNADNFFQYGKRGILAHNFAITNSNQVLSVNSSPQTPNAPLNVRFDNFHIETLTRLAQQDSLQVGGVINGTANVSNIQKSPLFTANMNVGDFSFKGDTVGNIAIKVNNQTAGAYAANVSITGKGNQVDLTGLYYTDGGRLDMNLNIVNLGMKSIEGFSFGSLKNASGNITGALKITGTTAAPAVRGDINFNKVAFNVAMLNSYFTMPNESITFNNDGILFNDFTLVDSTGNKAILSGTLYTKTFTDFRFGLDLRMDNFRVINSTQADNRLYYGKLFLDSRIRIRGDLNKPIVDGSLTVNDNTNLTIVLPTNDPGVEDRKGVVEDIDQDAPPNLDSVLMAKQLDSIRRSDITGLDVNMTVKVNKNANFNIVIDERNGDVVHISGEANLQGGIDPSGKTNLTGTFVVNRGSYQLSYATVNRRFDFKPGSTITWTGDPTSANIDLTAVYIANVPPIDLVNDQLTGSESERTMYKQKLPFNINLNLRNQLLAPRISFDIVLPDSNYTVSYSVINTVQTRLTQIKRDTNELNKQVLGVLVLGHFIGDNIFQSQGGSSGIEGSIRNSVSSLLSDQLNKLAGNLIAGVNLNFDVTSGEDYSSGTAQNRTDLNVGLSKNFLNDRLSVTVGNNFNLEGGNQPGEKSSNIAGNLSVNYKLSKDGRYVLRAYRRNEYIVIQGQVIETGVGFTLSVDYNRFREIFSRTREEKEMRRRYKQEQKDKEKKQDAEQQPAQDTPKAQTTPTTSNQPS
ncbi:translocation/assembly module TamB domain-containing protein [Mucilaginibacter sp.]